MIFKRFAWVFFIFFAKLFATEPVEIEMWHAFEGFLYEKFEKVVEDFNHQSSQYKIKLVYQGNYQEVFEKGLKAFSEKKQPHILQVYEVATASMLQKPEVFKPVGELMRAFYKQFDPAVYIDVVREFYSTDTGEMCSLPWNASTGVLFYNKRLFKESGLDPEHPPKTWQELEKCGEKLVKAGYKGFATAWPAAYHLEHVCVWHNLPFATYENGYKGESARLVFNDYYQVRHIEKLVAWQASGIFSYKGRFLKEPEDFFTSGRCGMLLQGANRHEILKKQMKDPIGVGFIPYWSDVSGAPYNLNIGGTSFWALSGHSDDAYKGIAQFFAYLSLPKVQAAWHQETGYLPITKAAYYLTKKKGFYEKNPAAEIAVLEVMNHKPTVYTKGIRLINYPLIRERILDFIEMALKKEISPKEALDRAALEGNRILADKK